MQDTSTQLPPCLCNVFTGVFTWLNNFSWASTEQRSLWYGRARTRHADEEGENEVVRTGLNTYENQSAFDFIVYS